MLQCVAKYEEHKAKSELDKITTSVLQCVAVCCSVLQSVAVCCSLLRGVYIRGVYKCVYNARCV